MRIMRMLICCLSSLVATVATAQQQYGTIILPADSVDASSAGFTREATSSGEMTFEATPGLVIQGARSSSGDCMLGNVTVRTAPGSTEDKIKGEKRETGGIDVYVNTTTCTAQVLLSTQHQPPTDPEPSAGSLATPAPDPEATPFPGKKGKAKLPDGETTGPAAFTLPRSVIVQCPKDLNRTRAGAWIVIWDGYRWRNYLMVKTRGYFYASRSTGVVGEPSGYLGSWRIFTLAFYTDWWRALHWNGYGFTDSGPSQIRHFASMNYGISYAFYYTNTTDMKTTVWAWGVNPSSKQAECSALGGPIPRPWFLRCRASRAIISSTFCSV